MMYKENISNYWKSILIGIIIFILSTITFSTNNNLPKISNLDKIVHLLMYLSLSFTLYYDYLNENKKRTNNFLTLLMLCAIIYGGIIEIIQEYFIIRRTAEWLDWGADILGVGLGFSLGIIVLKKRKNE